MDDPLIGRKSALQQAQEKIYRFHAETDESVQIAGSGGKIWNPSNQGCPLEPASDHIIVKKEEAVGQVGSIILPDRTAQKTRPNRGTVLKVGNEVSLFGESGLRVGDVVIYHEYGEVKFAFNGADYIAIREKDVITRVTTDAE